jgi:hypothetical protein
MHSPFGPVRYRAGGEPITSTSTESRPDMGFSPNIAVEKANTVSPSRRQLRSAARFNLHRPEPGLILRVLWQSP